ncbi:FecR domain-containing protein [Thalassospira sp.]|uniref:FecR family protein n=1 Tax=Thalassospira sp. TaxID=1912094 RepID=UPI00273282F7|nr:FecR domain-containing protein [Thalassospira sp.]MDP2699680.1 FecR domain-containing protein [Thalassospira sp.]
MKHVWHFTIKSGLIAAAVSFTTLPGIAMADRGEQAGVSAAVKGTVELAAATGAVGRKVESGEAIYLGDLITSSAESGMQILLMDETVFTIGPNSEIAIDDFVYDPATGNGRLTASMTRGVMRFVTGQVAQNNPSSMNINLPVGSIGIRGTIGLIQSYDPEQANQASSENLGSSLPDNGGGGSGGNLVFSAVNQGPGLGRNDSGSRPGAFVVTSASGSEQPVTGENFGVFVGQGFVTEPTRFPPQMGAFDFGLAATQSPDGESDNEDQGQDGSDSENSGGTESTAETASAGTDGDGEGGGDGNGESANSDGEGGSSSEGGSQTASSSTSTTSDGGSATSGSGSTTTRSSTVARGSLGSGAITMASNQTGQTMAAVLNTAVTQTRVTTQSSGNSNPAETAQTVNAVTEADTTTNTPAAYTFEAMRQVTSGSYSGNTNVGSGGDPISYTFSANVNFADRTLGAGFSNVVVDNNLYYGGETGPIDYSSLNGAVTLDSSQMLIFGNPFDCGAAGCSATATFKSITDVDFHLRTDGHPDGLGGTLTMTED